MADTDNIQWHPAFVAAMQLEFAEDRPFLEFIEEYSLSHAPLRIDLVVIKKKNHAVIQNVIGNIFRGHNLLEYKSPYDVLNLNVFFKVLGYACLYKSFGDADKEIDPRDVTITILRESTPRKLFLDLEELGYQIRQEQDGIYKIYGSIPFLMQIIALKELSGDGHIWLRALTTTLSKEDVAGLSRKMENLHSYYDKEFAKAVLDVSLRANKQNINEMLGDGVMYEALMELVEMMQPDWARETRKSIAKDVAEDMAENMAKSCAESLAKGHAAGRAEVIFRMYDSGMEIDRIAEILKTTPDEIHTILAQPAASK